jgi:hypothetical protein
MILNNMNNNWWAMGRLSSTLNVNRNLMNISNNNTNNNNNGANISTPAGTLSPELQRGVDALQKILNETRGNANTLFSVNKVTSNNTDVLNIRSFDANKVRLAGVSEFSVDVLQVAQAQRNEGNALKANASAVTSGFDWGAQSMSLNVGNRQFDFNFTVSATDTNRDVQQKMADAINSRNTGSQASGVSARVALDSKTGESRLIIESSQTGVNNAGQPNFTLTGTSGNAVAIAGGNTITQQAQNAEFRVNNRGFTGALQTSRSNNVDLGLHGIRAELRDIGKVQVNLSRDEDKQINAFRDVVNSYNNVMRNADGRAKDALSNVMRSYSSTLSRLGVTTDRNGLLQINEDRLKSATGRRELERFLTDGLRSNFGFLNRLSRTAQSIARNPAAFAGETKPPRITSRFNQWDIGFMLNRTM